jgi:histidine phosphotransferase ChpT
LAQSNRAALNKLKFFRLAFGTAGGLGDMIDVGDIRDAMDGLFPPTKKVEIIWHIAEPQIAKPAAKILLNLGLIAGEALVRGGRLDLALEKRGSRTEIVVRAEGERIILDEAIRATLLGDVSPAELTPRLAPAWMAAQIARSLGPGVQISPAGAAFLLFGAVLSD